LAQWSAADYQPWFLKEVIGKLDSIQDNWNAFTAIE
jgi:hypothetical protein